ncbi:glutamate mutase L [Sulfurovum sp.]|uniref:glutamate mutase L n=1 Tax=Sulfurovum sp. TaxID=1969726 RepID=UPI002867FDEC|nr:glutamate mutase L [Sulfurovum sp.]
MNKLQIDIGSTYFKTSANGTINQHFRNFDTTIYEDLHDKCANLLKNYKKEEVSICSSANGGLSTLIIGITSLFSLKYATNIAFNSGINIIDTILYSTIEKAVVPTDVIDVVIVVGGIDGVKAKFDDKLITYLKAVDYQNIVYVGNEQNHDFLNDKLDDLTVLKNIIGDKLQVQEEELKEYLTHLYQSDITGKEDIKKLYEITSNQIYSTPYIVNNALPKLGTLFDVADPFLVIDVGGATTDIHYSTDLVDNKNIMTSSGYDRLVFKKLGVFKSRESLVFGAKNNEFVYELLDHLNVNEHILDEHSDEATVVLMQLAIFLVLYQVSKSHHEYVTLKLEILNSIVLTGGISKVLSDEDIDKIIGFFYKKILNFTETPNVITDRNYEIWTLGIREINNAK